MVGRAVLPLSFLLFSALLLLGPFLLCFLQPPSHAYRSRPPAGHSPHTPPPAPALSPAQLAQYHRDGFLVLRNYLSPDLLALLETGTRDLLANRTLHCDMAKYSGPPIFHQVINTR